MDFKSIDGYMFEDLISNLLLNMGFSVEQTSLSGDGGIDIKANFNEHIFKGKYIIQCKKWDGPVGQPVIRDLFGVVMSEYANKGILVTTSYFTNQAIEFAQNKNIELIGYNELIFLLNKYNITENKLEVNTSSHFTNNPKFNSKKYLYLKSKIENNKTEELYYEDMQAFFHSCLNMKDYNINKNGLIEEYIELNNNYIKRFCKGSNKKKNRRDIHLYINAYLYILHGEIFKAVEIYKDLGLLKPKRQTIFLPEKQPTEFLIQDINSPRVMLKNLYLLFKVYKYEKGCIFLEELFKKSHPLPIDKYDINGIKLKFKTNYENLNNTINEIKNNNYNKFHFPIKVYQSVDKSTSLHACFDEDNFFDICDILNIYHSKKYTNIRNQLSDLDIFFV